MNIPDITGHQMTI